jgi:hypothetical protein
VHQFPHVINLSGEIILGFSNPGHLATAFRSSPSSGEDGTERPSTDLFTQLDLFEIDVIGFNHRSCGSE